MSGLVIKTPYGLFDSLFNSSAESFIRSIFDDSCGYSVPNFPPVDVKVNTKTKDMVFEFALAGYSEDEISISYEGDMLKLSADMKNKKLKEDEVFLKEGLKKTKFSYSYAVPSAMYDKEKIEASFKDGVLTIKVPSKIVVAKPTKIPIKVN